MTPEEAAERAAKILDQAREHFLDGQAAAALVAVADGWTRLHTALVNAPKTIEPAPTVNISGLTVASEADAREIGEQLAEKYERLRKLTRLKSDD